MKRGYVSCIAFFAFAHLGEMEVDGGRDNKMEDKKQTKDKI